MAFTSYFFLCTLTLSFAPIQSQSMVKSITLKPDNLSVDGVVLRTHTEEVITVNNTWITRIISPNNWQFVLILDDSWGFHPSASSSIQITIDSPSVTTEKNTLESLLFGFTSNHHEYISTLITLNQTVPNKIYPSCNSSSPQMQAKGNMDSLSLLYRKCSALGSLCTNNWHDMYPINVPNILTGTPFSFKLENDPTLNTLHVSFHHSVYGKELVQHCAFTSMQTNNGLKVYIGANNANDTLRINSFEISASSASMQTHKHVENASFVMEQFTEYPTFEPTEDHHLIDATTAAEEAELVSKNITAQNEFRYVVIPVSLATTCLVLLVFIRMGCDYEEKETTLFTSAAPGFEHVDSFSIVSGYFIRVHYKNVVLMYNMMEDRIHSTAHWKSDKYDALIQMIENKFHLHYVTFRLYEIVDGKEEDINGIDDIIVAFDCAVKDSTDYVSIDIYVEVEKPGENKRIKHSKKCAMGQGHWYNMISPTERKFRHKRCKRKSLEEERKGNIEKAIDYYLEEKMLEMMEITTDVDDELEASQQALGTMNYYD